MAGVTVIWNSPALPPLADVDVAVREEIKPAADAGMSWSPAEVDLIASDDTGVNDDDDDGTGCNESKAFDDNFVVIIIEGGGDEFDIFVAVDDDEGGERRDWYQSRFCSNVSKIALASG